MEKKNSTMKMISIQAVTIAVSIVLCQVKRYLHIWSARLRDVQLILPNKLIDHLTHLSGSLLPDRGAALYNLNLLEKKL